MKDKYKPLGELSKRQFPDNTSEELKQLIPSVKPYIVCAAVRHKEKGYIICSARHFDMLMHRVISELREKPKTNDWEQGFIDQWGRFHHRDIAAALAKQSGQKFRSKPTKELYSEDLY